MWSIFLIEHLYLSGIQRGLQFTAHSQKDICYDETGLCPQGACTILGSSQLEDPMYSYKGSSTLIIDNYNISTQIMKFESIIIVIANPMGHLYKLDPMINIVCRVGNANNRVTTVQQTSLECLVFQLAHFFQDIKQVIRQYEMIGISKLRLKPVSSQFWSSYEYLIIKLRIVVLLRQSQTFLKLN